MLHVCLVLRAFLSQQEAVRPLRGASSVVSLSTQHGLTVSIKNNIASNQPPRPGMFLTTKQIHVSLGEMLVYLKLSVVHFMAVTDYHIMCMVYPYK